MDLVHKAMRHAKKDIWHTMRLEFENIGIKLMKILNEKFLSRFRFVKQLRMMIGQSFNRIQALSDRMHSKEINGSDTMMKRLLAKKENMWLQMAWAELCFGQLITMISVAHVMADHIQLSKQQKRPCSRKSGKYLIQFNSIPINYTYLT